MKRTSYVLGVVLLAVACAGCPGLAYKDPDTGKTVMTEEGAEKVKNVARVAGDTASLFGIPATPVETLVAAGGTLLAMWGAKKGYDKVRDAPPREKKEPEETPPA